MELRCSARLLFFCFLRLLGLLFLQKISSDKFRAALDVRGVLPGTYQIFLLGKIAFSSQLVFLLGKIAIFS